MRAKIAGAVVLAAAFVLPAGSAIAAQAAVLPLKHEPEGRVAALALAGALRRALELQQLVTVDDTVVLRLQEVIPDSCTSQRCMNRIAELVDAQLLVGGRLRREADGGGWILQLWLYDRRKQSTDEPLRVATTQDRCDSCQLAQLSRFAEKLATSLLEKADTIGESAHLTVRSRPRGAVVRIDGTSMGVTNMTFGVTPGAHLVTLHKPGYRISSHRLQLQPRDRREVSATLALSDAGGKSPPRVYRWLKWTLAGAAVVALGVGVGLWARGRVSSASGPGVEPEITNYGTPGIALTAVGGALAGGAVALFLLDRPSRPPAPVAVQVTDDGAMIGYHGAF